MYNMPEMMKHLRGWKTRVVHTDGRLDSWTDGSIFRGTAGVDLFKNVDEHDDVLPFALCTDSTVVKLGAQTSLTPCTCDNLALPLWLRMVFQSKFLWAVLPEGAKPNALYALPFLEDGARFRPGTQGIDIDGTFRVFVTIAHLISDTRGVGGMLNCKEIGFIIGACQQCTVTAYVNKQLGSQYYPSAIRTTPQGSPQRVAFEELYRKLPLLGSESTGTYTARNHTRTVDGLRHQSRNYLRFACTTWDRHNKQSKSEKGAHEGPQSLHSNIRTRYRRPKRD